MTIEEFNRQLEIAGLRKKEFATKTGLSYGTVTNWGQINKPVPKWVESWLRLYLENQAVKQIMAQIKESGLCEEKTFFSDE